MEIKSKDYFASIKIYEEASNQAPSQHDVNTMKAFLALELPVAEAAHLITRRTSESTNIDSMMTRRWMLWFFINNTAVNLPSVQPLIVKLLKTIRTLETGSQGIFLAHAWANLEDWGNTWADAIGSFEGRHLDLDSEEGIANALKWPQAVAYTAHLMASGDPELAHPFFILRSSTCIIRALDIEGSLEDLKYEADLKAAAKLFIICPKQLLEKCQTKARVEGIDERNFVGRFLWEGKLLDLSLERWNHWATRWKEIKKIAGVNQEINDLATKSLEAMNKA